MGKGPEGVSGLRVVLDTNIVLSALLFSRGRLSWLRIAWQEGRIIPLASKATVEELIRVLAYPKFRLAKAEREVLLADYLPYCETVTVPDPPPAIPACRDAQDNPFLWLALAGGAARLVTGDDDLLVLAELFPIPIVTATALAAEVSV